MIACKTTLNAADLPDNLAPLRGAIERNVPHGRTTRGRDYGSWYQTPTIVDNAWASLKTRFDAICAKYPQLEKTNHHIHLGTLGTGNHFIEVCLDENNSVWIMLHSGSRGVGNAIGNLFINLAKEEAIKNNVHLPDQNLAYFAEGSTYFEDYCEAVE